MKNSVIVSLLFALALAACDSSTSPSPSSLPPPPSLPPLQISGFVSQFEVIPTSSGQFADINYEVTITSSRRATGCFIRVNWLDVNDLQVGFTFLAADVTIPAGISRRTNQDFDGIDTALRIKDSHVEFSNCSA